MGRTAKQSAIALSVMVLMVLNCAEVFGEEPDRPVLPAGTEVRVPSASTFVLDSARMLISRADADHVNAMFRHAVQLEIDLVECNQTILEMSDPPATPTWLVAIKWIGAGVALSASFAVGLWAGGGM